MRVESDLVLSRVEVGDELLIVEEGVVIGGYWRRREEEVDLCGEVLLVGGGVRVRVLDVFGEGERYWCGYIEVEVEESLMRFDVLGPDIWQVCERSDVSVFG
tara:strand:- start:152 stop:457 length:306 start_codon:yes stop_codon:yes gene_type:complete